MNNFIPNKSIFGFKVLNSWNSILAAYAFISAQNLISPLFGYSDKEIIAGSLFIIISNISILILIINNIVRAKKISYLWLIPSFPLTLYTPIIIKSTFTAINNIFI